jgi:hypothetical protein
MWHMIGKLGIFWRFRRKASVYVIVSEQIGIAI